MTAHDCQAMRSDDWTSYGVEWCRADTRPRPDFDLSPQSMLYRTLAGDPLFTVISHGGVPSEGIFTLIAEAPHIRDEIDGRQHRENEYVNGLIGALEHLARLAHSNGDAEVLKVVNEALAEPNARPS